MLIMEYADKGNLRGYLTEILNNWKQKLFLLYKIIVGLNSIHEKDLIHCNLHDGNILCNKYLSVYGIYVSDYLGSYQSVKSFLKKDNMYGVIPFIAPEILRGEPYTPASDIYNFSMIMWEFTSGIPPFNDRAHDLQLALSICKGERPEIIENTPQCYIDLMKKCWDDDPSTRPSASEVLNIIKRWIFNTKIEDIDKELESDIMEFINAPIDHNKFNTKSHPQAYYRSRLLNFTSKEVNEIQEEFQGSKFLELKQKKMDIEQELHKLEMIAETYYHNSQNELKENQFAYQMELKEKQVECQDIQMKLDHLQQKNSRYEQDYQYLRLQMATQINEFARKEDDLQEQIIELQKEKQDLAGNLNKQLEENKLINEQVQNQTNLLEKEKIDVQEKLIQTEAEIQRLKSEQESLVGQKEQLEIELNKFQDNYKQIEQEKIEIRNMLSQEQKLNAEQKAELEEKIKEVERRLINEEEIKKQLTEALQIKEDKLNKLEQELINLDQERIKKLVDKREDLNKMEKELVNKLTSGVNTREYYREKEAKQKEIIDLEQELSETSASYDANRKKQVLNQVNKFLKTKDDFLTYREEAIKQLQKCHDRKKNAIDSIKDYTKEFQNILVKYNDKSLQLNKDYNSLTNIVKKNKELKVSYAVENILKLSSFKLNEYNIFKFATNSQEGTKTKLNSSMMKEDIDSLRENLNELKLKLEQEKEEIKGLAAN
jgi:hypothetical protein